MEIGGISLLTSYIPSSIVEFLKCGFTSIAQFSYSNKTEQWPSQVALSPFPSTNVGVVTSIPNIRYCPGSTQQKLPIDLLIELAAWRLL